MDKKSFLKELAEKVKPKEEEVIVKEEPVKEVVEPEKVYDCFALGIFKDPDGNEWKLAEIKFNKTTREINPLLKVIRTSDSHDEIITRFKIAAVDLGLLG